MTKYYDCQIPDCNNKSIIRSRVKTGEFKGLSVCSYCKVKFDGRSIKQVSIKKAATKKNTGLPTFFSKAIEELNKNPYCQNCGGKIKWWLHPVNNIAHILAKRNHKSVMLDENNYLFLCASKDELNACHEKFDNDIYGRVNMLVFELAKNKYELFKEKVLEYSNERTIFERN